MTSIAKQHIQNAGVLRLPNLPGGFLQVAEDGTVPGRFRQQVDTEANLSGLALKNGELAYASDTESLFIGDGATAGGLFLHQNWQTSGRLVTAGGVMTLSSSNPAVNSYSVPLTANSQYEFYLSARFLDDTSNTSNFRIQLVGDPYFTALDNTYPNVGTMDWFDVNGDERANVTLESQHFSVVHPQQEAFIIETGPRINLTLNSATVNGSFRLKTAASPLAIKFRPHARVSSPSTASCDLMVLHRRIG